MLNSDLKVFIGEKQIEWLVMAGEMIITHDMYPWYRYVSFLSTERIPKNVVGLKTLRRNPAYDFAC